MKQIITGSLVVALAIISFVGIASSEDSARIKDIARLASARDNALVGYGIVTGLAGTGDSTRTLETFQSISNLLRNFSVNVSPSQVRGRNAASVIVTASLPPFMQPGAKIDINVASLGDARSLVGGTLLMAHLIGPDGQIYALAQGPISVGGYSYDLNGNLVQKNHPTTGAVPGGATLEREATTSLMTAQGELEFVLSDPDFTTANRIAEAINSNAGVNVAKAIDAGRLIVSIPASYRDNIVSFVTKIENVAIAPDQRARVVVNERTGTVVAGGDVKVSQVSVTHGDLKVFISTDYTVSQPLLVADTARGVRTEIVPNTAISVTENTPVTVALHNTSTVGDLVAALNRVKASSRDIIVILQAIKRAGALHAELIIQ